MTVGCSSCKSPASARSGSSSCSPQENVNVSHRTCKRFRSTKGASKARRDHINGEIRNMRALLPIRAEEQERLSYLHSMSIICTFIRKSVLLPSHEGHSEEVPMHPYEDLLHTLPGFIVAMTQQGKLVYVSENVSQYLGFSMVDVLQGDTFYDMIDNSDEDTVKFSLDVDDVDTEKSFVCRMHTSKAFRLQHGSCCPLLVRGRFHDGPQQRLFVAMCTPIVSRPTESDSLSVHFQTLHRPDMSYAYAQDSVVFHLGYKAEEMIGRSWYSILHPDDLSVSACGHKHLMQQEGDGQLELVVRLQAKDLTWVWLYVWAAKDTQNQEVTCTNYVISETEAIYMKENLSSNPSLLSLSPPVSQMPWGPSASPKRQAECSAQYDGQKRKSRRLSEPTVSYSTSASPSRDQGDVCIAMGEHQAFFSTPPYSPASSLSSAAHEDCSSDFLQEAYGGGLVSPTFCPQPLEQLPSHAFTHNSFSLDSHPMPQTTYTYQDCLTGSNLVPDYQPEASDGLSDCALHPDDFSLPPLSMSGGDGVFHVSDSSGSSPAELPTPDPSLTVDSALNYSEKEQAEISILAHQISSLASSFDMYRAKSNMSHVNHSPCWPPTAPLNPEPILDERVIGSVLQGWTGVLAKREGSCGWPLVPRLLLEDATEVRALSLDTLVDSSPSDLHSADSHLEPSGSRYGCQEDNIELHQLSVYLHDDFQQDGFVDESMY